MTTQPKDTRSIVRKIIFMVALLTAALAQDVQATDSIRRRSCRTGTPRPQSSLRHAPVMQRGENTFIGTRHQLVVLASFQDLDFQDDDATTMAKWDRIFNAEHLSEAPYIGSIHDYFQAQSYGKLDLRFDLVMLKLPGKRHKYRSTLYDDENSQYMVDDIIDALQQQGIDWSPYDWDGDTFVNQLLIIYAGKGMNAGGDDSSIWPHQWWLSQHLDLQTEVPGDYRDCRTMVQGTQVYSIDSYCCVQEIIQVPNVETSFGTICHEYSHCFGFPDYYYDSNLVVGEWDIMDYGLYNGKGFRPCGYSAHERWLMGWLSPIELTESGHFTNIPPLSDEPCAYLIRNNGFKDEYYIIENRQQRGWDGDLPGQGLLIFHVDFEETLWTSTIQPVNSTVLKRYELFHANSFESKDSKDWAYPYILWNTQNDSILKLNRELTNTSEPAALLNHPNADGQRLMSKPITQMTINTAGLASFQFEDNISTSIRDVAPTSPLSQSSHWYTLDGRRFSEKPTRPGLYIHQGRVVNVR